MPHIVVHVVWIVFLLRLFFLPKAKGGTHFFHVVAENRSVGLDVAEAVLVARIS